MPLLPAFTTRQILIEVVLDHCRACPADLDLVPLFVWQICLDSDIDLNQPLPLWVIATINQWLVDNELGVYPDVLEPRDLQQ